MKIDINSNEIIINENENVKEQLPLKYEFLRKNLSSHLIDTKVEDILNVVKNHGLYEDEEVLVVDTTSPSSHFFVEWQ